MASGRDPREPLPGWLEIWDLDREPWDEWLQDMLRDLNEEARRHFGMNMLIRVWNYCVEEGRRHNTPWNEIGYKYYRIVQKSMFVHFRCGCRRRGPFSPYEERRNGQGGGAPPPPPGLA
ncbi:vpx protein [Simian immunodeficiency virus]|uniref:Protein Vpx n=1 Tax=Simian immunodeficiency virus agm.grivet (isolate AGM gr-1) TaxID=31684 RepID=VPX_SIVG1|nr:vpx protein [Simian immunodeficiency virus]Q02842.1 RecName: Full=Protein Vpx; AltName: Full=Viral protein X; AltName: Full=X ORF protein [Simian immunodeficiency virus (isolate AGM / clone GRI-1)]AAA47590.1 vpx protein [Simian immunodeficiency virus]AAA91925.1 vpx protein [Simian immunodeficiency virus]